jgi:hypothetical protein
MARRTRVHLAALRAMPLRARAGYAASALKAFADKLLGRFGGGAVRGRHAPRVVVPPALQAVYDATLAAIVAYRPGRYDGTIRLILPAIADPHMADPAWLWRDRCARLETCTVPGDHRGMVQGAQAETLAAALTRAMAT